MAFAIEETAVPLDYQYFGELVSSGLPAVVAFEVVVAVVVGLSTAVLSYPDLGSWTYLLEAKKTSSGIYQVYSS